MRNIILMVGALFGLTPKSAVAREVLPEVRSITDAKPVPQGRGYRSRREGRVNPAGMKLHKKAYAGKLGMPH